MNKKRTFKNKTATTRVYTPNRYPYVRQKAKYGDLIQAEGRPVWVLESVEDRIVGIAAGDSWSCSNYDVIVYHEKGDEEDPWTLIGSCITTEEQLTSEFPWVRNLPIFLASKEGKRYLKLRLFMNSPHLRIIEEYYSNRTAQRSGVRLIEHIYEGLMLLKNWDADIDVMRGWCLHPIVQEDKALEKFVASPLPTNIENERLALTHILPLTYAMEYRSVANAYLSKRTIKHIKEIELSCLPGVNLMLKADKIQNRKDFELYHLKTHRRSKQLQLYFANWFDRLGITEEEYQSLIKDL